MESGEIQSFSCRPGAFGTAVKIEKTVRRYTYLTLCEVWVYATGMSELKHALHLMLAAAYLCVFVSSFSIIKTYPINSV